MSWLYSVLMMGIIVEAVVLGLIVWSIDDWIAIVRRGLQNKPDAQCPICKDWGLTDICRKPKRKPNRLRKAR